MMQHERHGSIADSDAVCAGTEARRGFSLMEVLLSTSILVGSSIALIELATIGRKQANSAHDLNLAQLICQAKLDEIVAGIATVKRVEANELEDNPGWFYSVELEPIRSNQLIAVKVSVFQEPRESRRSQQFTLVRWLPDTATNLPKATSDTHSSIPPPSPRREDRP